MDVTPGGWMVLLPSLATVVIGFALVVLALSRFKKANIRMDVVEFFTRLIRGRGFAELDPEGLQRILDQAEPAALLVDLREPGNFQ